MIRVRLATIEDLPAAMQAARKFHDEAPAMYREIPLHEERLRQTLEAIMQQQLLLVATTDAGELVGYTGASCTVLHFSFTKVACELFWWVEPAYRGRAGLVLFRELVRAVRASGAQYLFMSALFGRNLEELAVFYERKGFAPSEMLFVGRV